MAYPGYGGPYGNMNPQMGMIGQTMAPNLHGGFYGQPQYAASDPMWSYFTAVAGQIKRPFGQQFCSQVCMCSDGEDGRRLFLDAWQGLISPDICDRDGEIDAEELQRCLTQAGVSGTYSPFSLETCRVMIAMLDMDHTGKMGFNEFKELWGALSAWKQNFCAIDRDRSGTVEHHEMNQAILSMGYRLNPQTLNVLVKRYSKNGRIYFDDYVACCVKLRALTDVFRRRDALQQGMVSFMYDDFLLTTMAL